MVCFCLLSKLLNIEQNTTEYGSHLPNSQKFREILLNLICHAIFTHHFFCAAAKCCQERSREKEKKAVSMLLNSFSFVNHFYEQFSCTKHTVFLLVFRSKKNTLAYYCLIIGMWEVVCHAKIK